MEANAVITDGKQTPSRPLEDYFVTLQHATKGGAFAVARMER
jgi:hypothetical protein